MLTEAARSTAALDERPQTPRNSLINPFSDFWLLGGASIVIWAIFVIAELFRAEVGAVQNHFLQVPAFFSMLTLFCNHPHFMISYRFGYGRGPKFIFKHSLSLIFVPLALIVFYAFAYLNFDADVSHLWWVEKSNVLLAMTPLSFRFGTLQGFGTEALSLSVWLMFLTVGWHYSKQVFGCMAVYAKYDNYPLTSFQRKIIKSSLYSVAFFNFFYFSIYAPEYSQNPVAQNYFFNIPLVPLGLPSFLIPWSAVWVGLQTIAFLFFVCFQNYQKFKKIPGATFLVSWIAFHVWWIPLIRQPEFYFLLVPFFHSLQYLPFAYRLSRSKGPRGKWFFTQISIRVFLLLFIGFCAFELVPSMIDNALQTPWYLKTWFFMIAFAIFINVHHFFIDSVTWKMNEPEVRGQLF